MDSLEREHFETEVDRLVCRKTDRTVSYIVVMYESDRGLVFLSMDAFLAGLGSFSDSRGVTDNFEDASRYYDIQKTWNDVERLIHSGRFNVKAWKVLRFTVDSKCETVEGLMDNLES